LDSISIIIPAFNEERRLGATLEAVLAYLQARQWRFAEVVVVDDGSSDGTARLVREYSSRNDAVRLAQNPGNRGKGYSVRHGVMEARGGWVLFSDADLSAPIEEADKIIRAARASGAMVAIGSRGLDRSMIEVHQSGFREFAGRVFNLCMRLLTGLPFADTQCGFKLYESEAARNIFRRQRLERFGFDAEVLFIARRMGYKIVEVPVRWRHSEGTKVSMLRDSMNMFLDLLRVRFNALLGRYD
jgi:glycosyltransferase involved in cell wall biosynthesis